MSPTTRADPLAAAALVAVAVGVLAWWTRSALPEVAAGLAADGAIALAWSAAAVGAGASILRILKLDASGALWLATSAALGWGAMSLVLLALAWSGMLNRWTAIGIIVLGIACFAYARPGVRGLRLRVTWAWVLVGAYAATALAGASIVPGVLWFPNDPQPYDVLCYHLQVPREWFEAGRMLPLQHNVYSYLPMNLDLQFLMAMHLRGGPYEGMYLAQLMSFTAAAAGVVAIGAAFGRAAALLATVTPWVTMTASVAYVESGLILYTALAIAWMLRAHASDRPAWRPMLVAGAAAGLACGVKMTALPIVCVPLLVAHLWLLVGRADRRAWLGGEAVAVGVAILVLSPWLVRNAVWTGNPVFPLAMRTLGSAHFTPEQVDRFEQFHRPGEFTGAGRPAREAWSKLLGTWQFGYVLFPAAAVAAVVGWRRREVQAMAILLAGAFIAWLLVGALMGRHFVPAMVPAAGLVGLVFAKHAAWIVAVQALFGLTALPIDANRQLPQGLVRSFATFAQAGQQGMYRLTDPTLMYPQQLIPDLREANIALIGTAEAFLWPVPREWLRYRTGLDVAPPAPGTTFEDAWLGEPVESLRRDAWVIIDARNAAWSAKSYDLPPPSPWVLGVRDAYIVLPPTGGGR